MIIQLMVILVVDKSVENKKEKKISKIKEQLARLREKLKADKNGKVSPILKPKPKIVKPKLTKKKHVEDKLKQNNQKRKQLR